jgi:hypothetical protein
MITRFSVQSLSAANLVLFTLNRKFFRSGTDTFSFYPELDNVHKYVYCRHVTDIHDVIPSPTKRTASLGHESNMLVCAFLALPAISRRYPRVEGVSQ